MRIDGRQPEQIRPISITPDFISYPEGSALIELGNTRVLCSVTIENTIPRWMSAQGKRSGWVTAEYAMLPRSTQQRTPRETRGFSGRTQEIRRLVGRSLRAALDLDLLGERTCLIDCDVLQADGGTRTASVTGAYVALAAAIKRLETAGEVPPGVLSRQIAAISAGIVDGKPILDLCYAEDSSAQVDINVIMTSAGDFIEVQGTAEGSPFSREKLNVMLNLASQGMSQLFKAQQSAIDSILFV